MSKQLPSQHQPPDLSGRKALTSAYSQIESKLFNVSRIINPLVASASPILTLLNQLQRQAMTPNYERLFDNLIHEIQAFETKAQNLGYRSEVVLAGRYLLCSVLDATIISSHWSEESLWQDHYGLLQHFQGDNVLDGRVITMIQRLSEDAKIYIDLLELSYLCLSLGDFDRCFGEHFNATKQHTLLDHLFHLIEHERSQKQSTLLIDNQHEHSRPKREKWRLPPTWVTILATVVILLGIYVPYAVHIHQMTQPLIQKIAAQMQGQ